MIAKGSSFLREGGSRKTGRREAVDGREWERAIMLDSSTGRAIKGKGLEGRF